LDSLKLEYWRKKRDYSVEDFCKSIGISKTAYYRKCKGISQFTQGEIQRIVDLLELPTPVGIFFDDKVS
jgi:transcriptional regulator with XRE-family HTH domain